MTSHACRTCGKWLPMAERHLFDDCAYCGKCCPQCWPVLARLPRPTALRGVGS